MPNSTDKSNIVFKRAYIFPIILVIWFPLSFVITYAIAVLKNDVSPVFPYISDAGNWSPESCIFGILLTTGGIFMIITVYVRYRQVRELCAKNEFSPKTTTLNRVSMYLGIIATYGVIIVANFQETNAFVVHMMGAGMCFGLGTVYQFLQVLISFCIYPTFGKLSVNIFRICCTVICIITLTLTCSFAIVSLDKFTDLFYLFIGDDITKWNKDDGGYDFHLVSVIAEWILAVTTQFFLVSYTNEFKLVHFHEPEIKIL